MKVENYVKIMKATKLHIMNKEYPYWSVPSDLIEYLEVHVGEADER